MKKLFFFILVLPFITSCGWFNKPATTGFDEVLNAPPFKELTDSINKEPNNADLLLRRGALLYQNNHQDIAYYDFKKSWQLQPQETTAEGYASNLLSTGRNKEAISLLKECIDKYPLNPDFKRRLAEAYINAKQPKEALSLYNNLLQTDSTNFEAWYEKGMLLTYLQDTTSAITALEQSYQLQPLLQTGMLLANLYAETKNQKVEALCDALQIRDTSAEAVEPMYLKGVYYANTKQYDKALAAFDQCMSKNYRFVEAYIEKAIVLYYQKNYKIALQNLDYAVNINIANPDIYFWKARCLEAEGKKEAAIDNYYDALKFDTGFTEAKKAIGRLE
jgi:tetratricopeptide (TPR) repeat protein